MKHALFLSAAALVAAPAAAQTGGSVTVIQAGRLLDKPGQAPRGPTTLVVRDGRIVEILPGKVDGPAGATIIDLSDKFVLPGLIDSHVHLDSDAGGNAAMLEGLTSSDATSAYRTLGNAKKTLMAGFTTVRNLGDGTGATLALRDFAASGEILAPRIVDAGRSISTTSGHMDGTLSLGEDLHSAINQENLCDGVETCRHAIRMQIRRGVDVIKIATTGGVNSRIGAGLGRQLFDDEVKALVDKRAATSPCRITNFMVWLSSLERIFLSRLD